MALPKLDNTQIEKNQIVIIQKIDALHAVLTDKMVPAIEKMAGPSIVEKMFPFVVQIADNIYNIAGKMEAQVTSLKEVQDALAAQAKTTMANEGQQIEAAREAGKKPEADRKEVKQKSALERLLEFLEKVIIPLVAGFAIGLASSFGLFKTTFGKIVVIFAALYASLSGFRKVVNAVVVQIIKSLPQIVGGIKSSVTGIVNGLKTVGSGLASGLTKTFNSIVSSVTKIAPNVVKAVVNTFREVVVMSANTVQKITSVVEGIGKFFSSAGSKIAGLFKGGTIGKAIDLITDSFKTVFNLISKIGNVGKVTEGAAKAGQFFAKTGQMFAKIGRLLGPIGIVISTVMALFQGIQGAFKGFDEEGVFGAIKGFTSGIITGLVGWIGDLGTWLLGKLVSLLGFDELGDKIAAFDFSGLLSQFIKNMFDTVKQAFTGFFESITGAFGKIFSGEDIIGGILELLGAVPMLLIDIITAPFKSLGDALKDLFDFDIGQMAKKLLVSMFPPDTMIGKVIGTGEIQEEVVAAEAKKADEKAKDNAAKAEQKAGETKPGTAPAPDPVVRTTPPSQTSPARTTPATVQTSPAQRSAAVPVQTATVANQPAAVAAAPGAVPNVQPAAAQAPGATPGAQPAIAMRPVQTRTPGQAINTDSQRVAAAQGGGGGFGGQTNIVAPQSSVVNAPSNQTVNAPLSAYGIFGGRVSYPQMAGTF